MTDDGRKSIIILFQIGGAGWEGAGMGGRNAVGKLGIV